MHSVGGWWKTCFHSEQHQLCEHPPNSPGLTGCIRLCLSVSPELMLKIHLKCLFLVFFPLLSKIHHNKGRLTHLWKLILAHCMFWRCRVVQKPCCIVLSEHSGSHRRSLVLLSWIGFLVFFFYQHLSCLFQTKPCPDLPRQQPFIVPSLPHSHIYTSQYPRQPWEERIELLGRCICA